MIAKSLFSLLKAVSFSVVFKRAAAHSVGALSHGLFGGRRGSADSAVLRRAREVGRGHTDAGHEVGE